MKKITLLLAGLMASGMASAVQLTATGQTVTRVDCALLNEDVQFNLTANVQAGVDCDAQTIAISTCHIGGRTTSRSAERNIPVGCDTDPQVECTGTEIITVTGAAMPTATTAAGTVISDYPGVDCTAAAAEANATAAVQEAAN